MGATNHFGHFLLAELLLPMLKATAKERGVATVVAVASNAHYHSHREGILPSIASMNDEERWQSLLPYGQSKLANVLHAQYLAERLRGSNVLCNSLNPGMIATGVDRRLEAKFRSIFGDSLSAVYDVGKDFLAKH